MGDDSEMDENYYFQSNEEDVQSDEERYSEEDRIRKIRILISDDRKEEFMSTIKRPDYFSIVSPFDLLKFAGQADAIECGAASVQGETGHTVDVKEAGECGGFPMHYAADGWSLGLIKLYLEQGAQIDVRWATHNSHSGGELPLNSALATFNVQMYLRDWSPMLNSYWTDWTPKKSIFGLIIRLCLPEARKGLNVVKFLAWNTKGAEAEIYHYAKKGLIIELAVLLMVAREKINAPFPFPSHDGSKLYKGLTIRQVIEAEIAPSMDEDDLRTIARGEGNSLTGISKEKQLNSAILLMLQVFERAGDAIDAYLQLERTKVPLQQLQQVANEVASLLLEAGFVLKHQDIDLSDLYRCSMDMFRKVGRSIPLVKPKYLNMRLSTQPCSIQPYRNNEDKLQNMTTLAHEVSNPKAGVMNYIPNQRQRLVSLQFPRDSSTLPSNVQSFHTLHSGDDGLSFKLPLTSETLVLNPDEVSLDMEEEIKDLIVADNKHEFVSIIKSQLEKQNPDISKSKLFPSELLQWVCCHRAVNCAAAILDGETDLRVDLNSAFKCGSFLLHHAAHSLSSGLIELYLQHGANANLRCDDAGLNFSGLLPLNVALKTLSCHQFLTDWTPRKTIYKLLCILCRPEMKEPLDAIRVLALKTKEVEEIAFFHAKEGHVIELAALLMVAREKVMAQNNDGSSLDIRIHQCIVHETTSLDEEFRSIDGSQCSKLVRTYEDKKLLMSSVLLLVEVFKRGGQAIEEYHLYHSEHVPPEWIPKEVAWILTSSSFWLEEEDIVMNDIECFSPKLGPPQSEELKECRALVKKFRMPLNSQQGGASCAKEQRSICFSRGYPLSSHVSRSYHTFHIRKPSCGSRFAATLEAEVKKTTKTSQHCVSNFPSNKKWVSFAFAIMRGLRRV